ncbi:hypothetical protein LAUMK35_05100 [Mycobacterium pseudokansasii]|uniref:Uncharacterized protein n=1 Tax=Mycobacterium pseudokansasii TaxID=2341080 RepID=A0A498QZF5_9MYCO|nr:hypothetical protein LAUMK35_05100 [Mycobacterium pseudokansasii]VBA33561.1 hypothetical protein LAUMK21_05059 [Mycobacterium pseudokansasii]VBA55261.1 hypothetical protein LAUMK142_05030 [Mycobacterium pseudokansasii]
MPEPDLCASTWIAVLLTGWSTSSLWLVGGANHTIHRAMVTGRLATP